MFRTVPLSIIRSLSTASCQQTSMTLTVISASSWLYYKNL